MEMEYYWYIFAAILAIISIIWAFFCIVHGKGVSHKILICSTFLLCVVVMVCFGGEAVLNHFDMGWRCAPFNAMLHLCFALFIPVLLCGIWQLIRLKDRNPTLIRCGVISMSLALIVIPISSWVYFEFTSCSNFFTEYNGQIILYATNSHGSYGSIWRYYLPINDLVHGAEITQDGWHGVRPWDRTS